LKTEYTFMKSLASYFISSSQISTNNKFCL